MSPYKEFIRMLSTGFYSGYLPKAPGTYGTVVGMILWAWLTGIFPVEHYYIYSFCVCLGVAFLGVFVSGEAERLIFSEKDAGQIVIDEIAGIFITLSLIPFSFELKIIVLYLVGFILFRFFDIRKPLYIYSLQSIRGGAGVMLDDILAGFYSFILIAPLIYYLN